MTIQACLRIGNSYTLNRGKGGTSTVFKKDEWVNVTEDVRAYLEENAVERVVQRMGKNQPETTFVQKFEFREGKVSTDTADEGTGDRAAASPPRKRSRS